ncbi:MAG: 5-oxoprolinase subunit PxpA [Pseudomonadota bacterium]
MVQSIDLNADLGEGCAFDAELMSVVSSCNIACGGHAGDDESMRTALVLAKQSGVVAGAHPSFPDRENFGRKKVVIARDELERSLTDQVRRLKAIADDLSVPLQHLKPHGALYNLAARDADLSTSIINVLKHVLPHARLVGPPDSETEMVARQSRVAYIAEGFADRAYETDGQLRDRQKPGAVLPSGLAQQKQALEIAVHARVTTYSGSEIAMPADSICVHGDTPGAYDSARQIRACLLDQGVSICAPG